MAKATKDFMSGFDYACKRSCFATPWTLRELLDVHGPAYADQWIIGHLRTMIRLVAKWVELIRDRSAFLDSSRDKWLLYLNKATDDLHWYFVNFAYKIVYSNEGAECPFSRVRSLLCSRACDAGLDKKHPIFASGLINSGQIVRFVVPTGEVDEKSGQILCSGSHLRLDFGEWYNHFHPSVPLPPKPVPDGMVEAAVSAALRTAGYLAEWAEKEIVDLGGRETDIKIDLSPIPFSESA